MKFTIKPIALLILFSTLFFAACKDDQKEDDIGKSTMAISMTDAPGDYKHIFIQIKEVEIRSNGNWESIPMDQTDTFDILQYTNGKQLLIAEGKIEAGATDEIRLVLADAQLVLKNGETHYLKVPSGMQSGLKVKLDRVENTVPDAVYYAVVDFDAARSIVETGNGKYILKPIIRGYWESGSGAVEGVVLYDSIPAAVYAINGNDTFGTAIAQSSGYYKIMGLPQANYNLSLVEPDGNSEILFAVAVNKDQVTKVDTVDLR